MGSISFAQKSESKEEVEDYVFVIVEEMPEFPGGKDSLYKFLGANIVYPNKAKDNSVQGKVYVNFTIEKDGSISGVKVLRSVHPLLDEEAVRVVELFPKWKPGKQKGKTVRVSYNLPISFVLNNNGKKNKKSRKK